MPKQIHKIDEFHGGLNDNADPRDILNNELAAAENVAVSELGKIRMLGGVESVHTAPSDADIVPGYGLFSFSHDMAGAEGGTIAESPTDYIAIADTNDTGTKIDISKEGAAFGTSKITVGTDTSGEVDFYYVDGALRTSSGVYDDFLTGTRYFGYIGGTPDSSGAATNRLNMAAASTPVSITDAFIDASSRILAPAASTYEHDEAQITAAQSLTLSNICVCTSNQTVLLTSGIALSDFVSASMANISIVTVGVLVTQDSEDSIKDFWTYELTVGKYNSGFQSPNQVVTRSGNGATYNTHVFTFDSTATLTNTGNPWGVQITLSNKGADILSVKASTAKFEEQSASYTDHSTILLDDNHNFHVALDQPGEDVEGAFGWDEEWEIGMSLVYDGNQESLITQLTKKSDASINNFDYTAEGARPPRVAIFCEYSGDWNKRITGAVVYMKRLLDKEWYPQYELDFIKGVGKALFSGIEKSVTFNIDDAYVFQFEPSDILEPQFALTYESRTGISHEEKSISSRWKTSCVANRRAYIGNLQVFYEDGDKKLFQDTMVRSLPNKFDIFPISESVDVAISDGEEIIALVEFNDRILQFKERTLYVINASQDVEILEDKLDYRGVTHRASVFKTEYGVVWANQNGCFFFDGKKVHDLLEKDGRPLIKDSTWESFIGIPLVGYNPKTKQVIVVRDCRALFTLTGSINVTGTNTAVPGTGTKFLTELHIGDSIVVSGETRTVSSITNNTTATVSAAWGSDLSDDTSPDCIPAGDAYIYDMVTRSWTKAVGAFPTTNKTNFVVDFNNDLIYSSHDGSSTSLLKKWTDVSTATLPKIVTKDIDFGTPSQKKSVKKVYISYKGDGSSVTVLYRKDGENSAGGSNFYKITSATDGSSSNATDSTTPLWSGTAGTTDWLTAELKPVAGSITCNSFGIEIDGTAATDFEINDISIVYRPKAVK